MPNTTRTTSRGFTIVELLIVIVIIAILAAITVVAYNGIQTRAKNSSSKSAQAQVIKKAELYKTLAGEYPGSGLDFDNYEETKLNGGVFVTPGNPDSTEPNDIGYANCSSAGTNTGAWIIRNDYPYSTDPEILGTGC